MTTRSHASSEGVHKDQSGARSGTAPATHAASSTHAAVAALQRTAGNRAVNQLLGASEQIDTERPTTTVLRSIPRGGQPLDPAIRRQAESQVGGDLRGVRVHTSEQAADSARAIGAEAYSVAQHIVFGRDRYAPNSPAGRSLLFHEIAHVAHRAHGGASRPGIAPPESRSERNASRFAASAVRGTGRQETRGFHDWGPTWEIHPQRLVTRGTEVHRDERVGLAPGAAGPAVGTVAVRTGDVVEMPDRSQIANLLAIEYTGTLSGESKWLQFVWFEMAATLPTGIAQLAGTIPTSSGALPFSTNPGSPAWAVDSDITNPFYESGALAIRSSSATTIFDRPGGSTVAPLAQQVFQQGIGATSVTFTAHFDTYLVQRDTAIYHVPWTATTSFTMAGSTLRGRGVAYSVGAAGNANGLPAILRTLLHSRYPAFKHLR